MGIYRISIDGKSPIGLLNNFQHMPTLFGKKLKELREHRGETQTQLGELLGITIKQVQRYENDVIPKADKIQVLNKHYKYDFFGLLRDVPHETTVEPTTSDLQAVTGAKSYSLDKYIMLLEDSLKEKKDQLKEVQARLTDLEGRQRDFLAKVENSIERYEHLVLTQLQNGKVKVQEDSTPIVHERSYKSQGKKL